MAEFSYGHVMTPSALTPAALANSRHEKSLGLLTTKFVALLQQAKDGVLDLKAVGSLSHQIIKTNLKGVMIRDVSAISS